MKYRSPKLLAAIFCFVIPLAIPVAVSSSAKNKKKKPVSTGRGSVIEGQAIFEKNCAMCHFADKPDKKFGPGLKDLFKNKDLPQSHQPATESNILEQIEKGSPGAKPMPMPAFGNKLTPTEIENLLAYLKTL